jgi:hypothetical protein
MADNRDYILHKANHKKGEGKITNYIRRIILLLPKKLLM